MRVDCRLILCLKRAPPLGQKEVGYYLPQAVPDPWALNSVANDSQPRHHFFSSSCALVPIPSETRVPLNRSLLISCTINEVTNQNFYVCGMEPLST